MLRQQRQRVAGDHQFFVGRDHVKRDAAVGPRGSFIPNIAADIVLESIRSMLKKSRSVEGASVRVTLLSFGPYSFEVEVFAYILAYDRNHFLALQEALLLQIMECVESAGVQIALPSQTVFLANVSSSTETGVEGLLKVPAPGKNASELAAKSA